MVGLSVMSLVFLEEDSSEHTSAVFHLRVVSAVIFASNFESVVLSLSVATISGVLP